MITTLTLAGALAVVPAPDAPAPWRTLAASGPAEAREAQADSWRRLSRGDLLDPDDAVRTGRRARATLAQRSTVLVVDPASEVVLPREGEAPKVRQDRGAVLYDVDGRTHAGMTIETPNLIAGVKGTVFVVTVRDGSSVVTVLEGLVTVTSRTTGEAVDVGAGDAALVAEGAEGGVILRPSANPRDESLPPEAKKRLREDEKLSERLATDDGLIATTSHATKEGADTTGSLLDDSTDRLLDDSSKLVDDVTDVTDDLVDDTRDVVEEVVKETTKLVPPLPPLPLAP